MSDYVDNMLLITAKERADLEKFLHYTDYNEKYFSFNQTVPMPQQIRLDMISGTNSDWYDWSLDNWGVKWDAIHLDLAINQFYPLVTITFQTPWNSPYQWLKKTSTLFPLLKFKLHSEFYYGQAHFECLMFAGESVYEYCTL